MKTLIPLYFIAMLAAVIALQNAGIIPPVSTAAIRVEGQALVRVMNTVDVDVSEPVEVDMHSVAGYPLVSSEKGMYIGVTSVDNTIIPIHWGEISIAR